MLGRQDVDRYRQACSTMRNFFPSFRGPAYSRAGTAFCGYSKQTGRSYPPRLLAFQFSSNQGLALEFGHHYMRVISDGAFVTEAALSITGVTQANPAQVSLAPTMGGDTATPITSGVTSSYNAGDTVTLAGGTYATAAVLDVLTTTLISIAPTEPGAVYAPGDTITFAGGTYTTQAVGTVTTTQLASATINAAGSGGTDGPVTLTGTTGTGTKFTVSGLIAGGVLTHVYSVVTGGVYTVNPSNLASEPVAGGGLTGTTLAVVMGIQAMTVTTAGDYTVNPVGDALTQDTTSGSGTGATANGVFGPLTASVATPGDYTVVPANPVAQGSTSGGGEGATFTMSWTDVSSTLAAGDWIYISGIVGMVELNAETFVVASVVGGGVTLKDVFGNPINSTGFTAYVSGGTVARIYTLLTIYSEQDLLYLKSEQSADVTSLCLVNQATQKEYVAQDLTRFTDTDWTFTAVIPAPSVLPPAATSAVTSSSGTTQYQYVVTAIDPVDGTESIASPIATISSAVDNAVTAGTITVKWNSSLGVNEYFIYKALPAQDGATIPPGSQFAYAGFSSGNSFIDPNIVPDFTQSPPTHQNPFARGQILSAKVTAGGSGYTAIVLSIVSSTGSGGELIGVLESGVLFGVIVAEPGMDYLPGDSISIAGTGGSGASAELSVGPESGTYPSVVGYFQERRAYANTLNNPDTYFMSQPGAFTNFDTRNPTIASDAVVGSPWAVQVNGVQWMIQTSGGLLVMTGLSAWLLVGSGSFATNVQPISPSAQNDVPQAFSGTSVTLFPVKINYDVVYADTNNVYYYDLPYQLYALSEPIDLTDVSSHLFTGFTSISHCWCEHPNKLLWTVRNDGSALSLTYYKTQKISGWARHDTQGLFVSNCSVIEPPVTAPYFAVQRFGAQAYYAIERMDNRIWSDVEDAWCVNSALTYPQPEPAATLSVSSAGGLGSITGATAIVGGANYSAATTGAVVDQFGGAGSGAVPTLGFTANALTSVTFSGGNQGSGYTQPLLVISDPAGSAGGSGASARLTLNNATTLTSSPGVFGVGDVNAVVRAAGGIAVITAYTSSTHVTANVLVPFTELIPGTTEVIPVLAGNWTKTQPITVVTGLRHLAGAFVTGLADGNVIPLQQVTADGEITLTTAASAIIVGLPFTCQMQDVPIDEGGGVTIQGQRKKIAATTLRLEASRGVRVGVNQPDGSQQSPNQVATIWSGLQSIDDQPYNAQATPNYPPPPYNALATPLRTGDVRLPLKGGIATPGQLAVQQDLPLPCNVVAIYSEVLPGDTPQLQVPQQRGRGQ